jgi:hypothetical protein
LTTTDNKENLHVPIRTLKDNNGLLHHQVQYPVGVSKKGKRRSMTPECKLCKETGGKSTLLDSIASHVENLWLIVVQIIIMIGIASACMFQEFNDAACAGKCEVVVVGVGKVVF